MWFLIAVLIVLWAIGYITFGARAYWVDVLLLAAIALFIRTLFRGRNRAS